MSFESKNREIMLTEMEDYITSHTDKVSDFNEGSLISSIIGAVANTIEEVYYEIVLGWADTMRTAMQRSINFNKLDGAKSSGNVVFSRADIAPVDYIIQAGSVVADTDGNRFITIEDVTLLLGQTESPSVAINSEIIGSDQNVPANTITTMVSTIIGIESVTNPTATINGSDTETEIEYNTRFAEYLKGLIGATPSGIKKSALDVIGVREVELIEPEDTAGRITIFINDGSGTASTELLNSVEANIEGNGTIEDAGTRPAGIIITYRPSLKIDIPVECVVYIKTGTNVDSAKTKIEEAITTHINSLPIGNDVILKGIEKAIQSVYGVEDLSISTPTANVSIDKINGEIAKISTLSVVIETFLDQ